LQADLKRLIHFLSVFSAVMLAGSGRLAAESPFLVDVWGIGDGLPQSSVITLTQTRDGYLWLGTQGGLARFDGNTFTPFNVNNLPGLPGNTVVFLYEDTQKNHWLGTDNGSLGCITGGKYQAIYAGSGAGRFAAGFDDDHGAVWFMTDTRQVFCWRNGALERGGTPDRALLMYLTYLAFHVIVSENDGTSWQLQNGRVEKWNGNQRENDFGVVPWGRDVFVTAACADGTGGLIVGTRGDGVYWFDSAGVFQHITKTNGLSGDYVLSLCFDTEKNLWVGTDGGGLDRVRKRIFFAPSALAGGVAQSLAEDERGGLWTTFNLRGVSYWLTNNVQQFDSASAWSVLVDSRQQVWVGTIRSGLTRFASGRFQLEPSALPAGRSVYALFETRNGRLCVGGENGLGVFDGAQWNFYLANNSPIKSPVRSLAEDSVGVLWIGTENDGLFTLRDGKISPEDSPFKDVSTLLVSADGSLWAGSFVHGLAQRQAAGNWARFSSILNGLANDDIGSLTEDMAGNLWIGSYEGLVRVEKRSLADVSAGRAKVLACRTFLSRECSAGAQPAAVRSRDGRLWFPTIEGVVWVNPADLKLNTNVPPVVIESVLVDGVPVSNWKAGIKLLPKDERMDVRFTALSFSATKGARFGARFKYRLEGRDKSDKNWTDIGTERVAHLNRLQPGNYVFHVAACNEDGIWNEAGASFAITVEPPFWRKTSFIASSILVALGILAGIVYLISTAKLKRQLRAARQKELIEKERSRIARDLHDQIGANLTQVTLLGEMAEADKELPGEVEQHALQIIETARETTRSLDEIVWSLNSANDTLESLANYACKYAQDYFALAGIGFRPDLPVLPATPILPEVRHNVFLAFKEAVNNVVKHAKATEARVKLHLEPGKFVLTVADNGRGLGDLSAKQLRNGLKNMRKRLADLGGEFDIAPGESGGTVVKFIVPLANK
jgi:signal transduction histidine kinase